MLEICIEYQRGHTCAVRRQEKPSALISQICGNVLTAWHVPASADTPRQITGFILQVGERKPMAYAKQSSGGTHE
jgi:hypothetical protein